ncbi:MAG TPA: hypothetical protein VEX13_02825 [Chloroflexia bacterium]|nr:hypothetical protein [Chloroflexia bacterium]
MAVLNQMFTERELAVINPQVRQRIETFTTAGAKVAEALEKSDGDVRQIAERLPELQRAKKEIMQGGLQTK